MYVVAVLSCCCFVAVCVRVLWLWLYMCRVGQIHIYTVYIRYRWQGNHQIYGHIRCIYTVLANPVIYVCVNGDITIYIR